MANRIAITLALLALSLPCPANAAEMQPMAVVSLAGYERLLDDVAALGEAGGVKQLPRLIGKFLERKTAVASLGGLDSRRPCGIVLLTDGLAIVPMALVPVSDRPKLLASLEKLIGTPQPRKERLWKIGRGQLTGYVQERGGWLYLAQTEENLRWLPEPEKVLGDLPRQFDAALQLNFQHVPDVFRTLAVDFVRLAMRNNLAQRKGETAAAHELRQHLAGWQFRIFEHLLTDSGQVTLGCTFDERSQRMIWDLRLTPRHDSSLARHLAALRKGKTRYGSVGDASPFSLHINWLLGKAQIEQLSADVKASRGVVERRVGELPWFRTAEERRTLQQTVLSALDVLEKTIRTGHLDLALAVPPSGKRGSPPADAAPITLTAAAHVGQGEPLRQALAAVARLGKDNPRFTGLQLDAARVKDMAVHAVIFSADQQPIARRLFGDELKLHVAVAEDSLWVAMGKDSLAALEQSMPRRDTAAPPVQLRFRLRSVIRWIEEITGQRALSLLIAKTDNSDDRVTLTVTADDQGLHARLTANEGVSRLLARGLAIVLTLQ